MGQQLFGRAPGQFHMFFSSSPGPQVRITQRHRPPTRAACSHGARAVWSVSWCVACCARWPCQAKLWGAGAGPWSGDEQAARTQVARAGVHRQRRREREAERQTGTERQRQRPRQRQTGSQVGRWAGGGWQSAKSGVRRTPMQPFMEKACQARLLEEVACSAKGRKAKGHIGCFGETNANLGVAFPQFPRTGAMPEQIGEFPFPVGPRK